MGNARGFHGDHKVWGLDGGEPAWRVGSLSNGRQLRQPAGLQTRRRRELHLLQVPTLKHTFEQHDENRLQVNNPQCCLPRLVCGHSGGPPVRLAEERISRGFSRTMGAGLEGRVAVPASRQNHRRLHRTEHLAHGWPDHKDGATQGYLILFLLLRCFCCCQPIPFRCGQLRKRSFQRDSTVKNKVYF